MGRHQSVQVVYEDNPYEQIKIRENPGLFKTAIAAWRARGEWVLPQGDLLAKVRFGGEQTWKNVLPGKTSKEKEG